MGIAKKKVVATRKKTTKKKTLAGLKSKKIEELKQTPIFEKTTFKHNGKQITGFSLNPDDEIIGLKPNLHIPNTSHSGVSNEKIVFAAKNVKLGMIVRVARNIFVLTASKMNGSEVAFWGVRIYKNKIN